MNLDTFSSYSKDRVDQYLQEKLTAYSPADTLHKAMHYSLFNGGKRVRPMLVYASARLVGEIQPVTDAVAAALESIHAYSLVHDDLPAMDDDDLRRGKPTCHKQFDEATAILAGDALQTFAFELLSEPGLTSPHQQIQLIRELSLASGRKGMVTGQMIDLSSVGLTLNLQALEQMHRHKTGALIRASVQMGAISAGLDPDSETATRLAQYADAIGLAFQVQDDVLDLTSETGILGKAQFSDQNADKPTYPSLMGLTEAQSFALRLCQTAVEEVSVFGEKAQPLIELANYIVSRNH